MNISYKSGEQLWSRERTSSLSLPERTRFIIIKKGRQKVEANPWAQEDNKRRYDNTTKAIIDGITPDLSASSNNTLPLKPKNQNQLEGTAPLPGVNDIFGEDPLTEKGVEIRKAQEKVEASYDDK